MKTNEEYRLLEQKLFDCENEVALADLKVRKLETMVAELEQQNLALLSAIEVKNAALHKIEWENWHSDRYGDSQPHCPDCGNEKIEGHEKTCALSEAIALNPSPDLLAKRDQKRDVELIKAVYRFCAERNVPMFVAAQAIESGSGILNWRWNDYAHATNGR